MVMSVVGQKEEDTPRVDMAWSDAAMMSQAKTAQLELPFT
jgi:hypothetical protein